MLGLGCLVDLSLVGIYFGYRLFVLKFGVVDLRFGMLVDCID